MNQSIQYQNQQQPITKTRVFNISSKNAIKRNGTKNSNLSIALPSLMNKTDNVLNIYFSIVHCEIPNSMYLINSNNNILNFGIPYTTTLTIGNYNVNTFMTMISSLLPSGMTLSYNSLTYQFTFSYTTSFSILSTSTCLSLIGLGTTTSSTSNSIICPYPINFLPLPRIHFRSPQLNFGCYNSVDTTSDTFLCLQNNGNIGGMILYNNYAKLRHHYEKEDLLNLDIRITDDNNNEIDFNNFDWYLSFQIDFEYLPLFDNNLSLSKITHSDIPHLATFDNSFPFPLN